MGEVLTLADVEAGQSIPSKTIHIDRATLVQYAGASLDRDRDPLKLRDRVGDERNPPLAGRRLPGNAHPHSRAGRYRKARRR